VINTDIDNTYGATAVYNGDTTPGSGVYNTCSNVDCHAGSDTPAWGGTLPNAGDCSDCHGNEKGTLTGQGEMTSGKHPAHIANADPELATFDCGRCHADTVTTGNNQSITGARHTDMSKDVYYDALNGSATANTCNTVYCHSDGKGGYNNQDLATVWAGAGTLDCKGCHGDNGTSNFGEPDYASGAAGAADANSHSAHVSVASDCGSCHTSTSTTGVDITGAIHTDGTIDVTIAAGYDSDADPANNYDDTVTVKQCSNVYCHSNGLSTYTTPQWGGSSTGCSFCHDDLPSSGAHAAHVQTAATSYGSTSVDTTGGTYDFGCGNCHPVTEAGNHRDGDLDITMNSGHGGTLKSKNNVADDVSGYAQTQGSTVTCSAAYCHSQGEGSFVASPEWYTGSVSGSCDDCHGNSPGTNAHGKHVVGIHYEDIYSGSTGLASAGTGNTDSHGSATYSMTINCNTCHNSTVTTAANDKNTVCTTCHNGGPATLQGDVAIAGASTSHINGTVDVALNAVNVKSKAQMRDDITTVAELDESWDRTASGVGYKAAGAYDQAKNTLSTSTMFDSTYKSCAAVACHNGKSAVWSDTGVDCTYCHSDLPR
jgi:predicted CxxxxCH...CXXCH cytochrome family protein